MKANPPLLHPLNFSGAEMPERFTYPFHYQAHPLCLRAADALRREVESHPAWAAEMALGKMVGVLVVEGGFLAAFSGTLCGQGTLPYFVPPVFDLHQSDSHFQREEAEISAINRRIAAAEGDAALLEMQQQYAEAERTHEARIQQLKALMDEGKRRRDELRAQGHATSPEMLRESQYQKAELRRAKQAKAQDLAGRKAELAPMLQAIEGMRAERARRSAALQEWLFEQFSFLNARGQRRSLREIFAPAVPPAAAGECCAPKLLQYAYAHGLRPLCMAEFWVGASPVGEVRNEGQSYPACQSRCRPILGWMLQGLEVEPNPLLADYEAIVRQMQVLYSDAHIAVVSKPAGMLSVPGKEDLPSVQSEVQRLFPQAEGPLIVHRLDMATSGLMAVALTPQAHRHLQQQFISHSIVKRYRARLSRPLPPDMEGEISLPLCPNPDDRPRQMVSREHGRPALTHYRTLGGADIHLWPHTGRTHQLRMHLAHPLGLGNPILGDALYGEAADRLHLHADRLEFTHPATGERMIFDLDAQEKGQ